MHHAASLLAGVSLLAFLGLALAQSPTQPAWTGTWKGARGTDGATMVVVENNGSLDVWGKDEASIYRLTCLVDAKDALQAQCVGDGVNHGRGTRFTYRSKLQLSVSGIVEDWEAQEQAGRADGRESFVRVPTRK